MTAQEAIVERWLGHTMQAYPGETVGFLTSERDPFRNPVGYGFRRALTALLEEVLGEMDPGRVADALDEIVRIRAVQDLPASQAVAFVFELRPILRELMGFRSAGVSPAVVGPSSAAPSARVGSAGGDAARTAGETPALQSEELEGRIDRLALTAFEQYTRCREQLAEIRLNESRRALERPTAFPSEAQDPHLPDPPLRSGRRCGAPERART